MTETIQHSQRSHVVLLTVRSVWHLVSVGVITAWGFVTQTLPMPGIAFGIGALVVSVLLWAMFLSPKPAIARVDRFAQSMIELFLLAAAVAAGLSMGVHPLLATAFGLIGVFLGFRAGAVEK